MLSYCQHGVGFDVAYVTINLVWRCVALLQNWLTPLDGLLLSTTIAEASVCPDGHHRVAET